MSVSYRTLGCLSWIHFNGIVTRTGRTRWTRSSGRIPWQSKMIQRRVSLSSKDWKRFFVLAWASQTLLPGPNYIKWSQTWLNKQNLKFIKCNTKESNMPHLLSIAQTFPIGSQNLTNSLNRMTWTKRATSLSKCLIILRILQLSLRITLSSSILSTEYSLRFLIIRQCSNKRKLNWMSS